MKERRKKGCLFLCFCAEGSLRDIQAAARRCEIPRERKLCPEHQDSLLGDCAGKSQQVSLLLWLPATFPSRASSVWAAGSAAGLCQCKAAKWEGEVVELSGAISYVGLLWRDTNAVPLLWPRPAHWAKKHLQLPISLCDLIWASTCRALIVKSGVLGKFQFLIAFMEHTFTSGLQNYNFILSSLTSQPAVMLAQSPCSIPVEHITKP